MAASFVWRRSTGRLNFQCCGLEAAQVARQFPALVGALVCWLPFRQGLSWSGVAQHTIYFRIIFNIIYIVECQVTERKGRLLSLKPQTPVHRQAQPVTALSVSFTIHRWAVASVRSVAQAGVMAPRLAAGVSVQMALTGFGLLASAERLHLVALHLWRTEARWLPACF